MDDEPYGSEYYSRYSQEAWGDNPISRQKSSGQTVSGVPIRNSGSSGSCDLSHTAIDDAEVLDKLADQDGKLSWGWK